MKSHIQLTKTCLMGTVIQGRQIGRTIGFPTANLSISSSEGPFLEKGVYGVKVYQNTIAYDGLMNIGVRPTFKDKNPSVSYEIHILNFNKDIYGEQLQVEVMFFIREEMAFKSKEQLIEQINQDLQHMDQLMAI